MRPPHHQLYRVLTTETDSVGGSDVHVDDDDSTLILTGSILHIDLRIDLYIHIGLPIDFHSDIDLHVDLPVDLH